MLKGINKIITGDLLKVLCDMGHGDTLAIVDANYPAHTMNDNLIFYPSETSTEILKIILELIPLDHIVDKPAFIMDIEAKDKENGIEYPEIWNDFNQIIFTQTNNTMQKVSRLDFYEKTKNSSVIIQTGEKRLYGNIIIVKGIL